MSGARFCRKIAVFLFLTLVFAEKISAFEIFKFSVAPKYGLEWGQMNEFLMYTNGNKRSELNWEIDSVNLLGFNASVGWEFVLIKVDCMWGFPKSSGIMKDSDWLNESNYGMKTNYSNSENTVDYLGNLDLRLCLNLKIFEFWYLIPYANISYNKIKFSAENCYGWYGNKKYSTDSQNHSWADPEAKYLPTGILCPIDYERETFNYGIGLETNFLLFERYKISLDFGLSVFTQINSIDKHYTKMDKSSCISYLDKMQGFFKSFNIGTGVDIKIWKGLSAGLGFNFVLINRFIGATYTKSEGDTTYKDNTAYNSAVSGYSYKVEAFVRYSF